MSEGPKYRAAQLQALIDALEHVLPLATQNRIDSWTPGLEYCLRFARHLLEAGYSQDDLDELSHAVTDMFGGAGSINDAVPKIEPKQFERWASATFDSGLTLRLRESKYSGLD